MNDPMFKHLSEDCQEYYFDFEAYASHLLENRRYLVTEHAVFELPEYGRDLDMGGCFIETSRGMCEIPY